MSSALDDQIKKELSTNPLWQIRPLGHLWLCPYCAEPGAKGATLQELLPQVARHLESCTLWQRFDKKPLSEAVLRGRANLVELARRMQSDPAWRLVAPNAYWICPFCIRVTDVRYPTGGAKLDVRTLQAIRKHLGGCSAYDMDRGIIHSVDEIKKTISAMLEKKRVFLEIQKSVSTQQVWQVKDADGNWVCPYCRQAIRGISIASQFLLTESAPALIARHLKEVCPVYGVGKKPAAAASELEEAVRKKAGPAAPVPPETPPQWLQHMEVELRDLKSKIAVSRDIEKGLEEARKKQVEMLPSLPKVPGFDFATLYRPSVILGGDFYDFIRVGDKELGIAIGDVSGHGIEAAIVMSMVKKLLNVHGRGKSFAGATLHATNTDIHQDLDDRTFISIVYGVLNAEARTINFVRAGHTPPILYNPDRSPDLQVLQTAGMVVGVDPGPTFDSILEDREIALQPGDVFVLYTDGLSEAMNSKGESLGMAALAETVRKYGRHDMDYLVSRLEKAAADHRGEAPQHDDIAIVGLKME